MQQSETLFNVITHAGLLAREKKINSLRVHHVLYALSAVENESQKYLSAFCLTSNNLEPKEIGRGGMMRYSEEYQRTLFRAENFAKSMGEKECNCIHMLLAILTMKDTYAYDKIVYLLKQIKRKPSDLFNSIVADLPHKDKFIKFVNAPDYEELTLNSDKKADKDVKPSDSTIKMSYVRNFEDVDGRYGETTALRKTSESVTFDDNEEENENYIPYSIDLTEKAQLEKLDPVIGREKETERIIQTLTRRTKNNPVLVGEAGVGKTAVVEGLASAVSQGRVPVELQNKRLIQLDMASMLAGTRYRGDFEERLTKVVSQIVSMGDVILFIDEIHNLVGAGATSEGSMGASEILKPALARGELQLIGATTTKEYRQYIEKDPALERRFQPITVEEPSVEVAIDILKGVRYKYEKHHGVIITDEAIEEAVNLSARYVTDRRLPDKAFDIVDEACSKLKISTFAVPPRLVELSNELKNLKRKLDSKSFSDKNAPDYKSLVRQYNDVRFEYEYMQGEYQLQLKDYKCTLTQKEIRAVVSQMTGVPVSELSVAEREKLVRLEEELSKRVIGQTEAVKAVARAVRRQRAGLKDPNRPIGSFIFVGPTGVGKTELAKALSECLFGSNSDVIRIDMSEYMEKQSTAKLIGAPPGYVGYDEGGYLTDKVQSRPYSVVLFDEIEKAHPDVFNLLLQILDEGRLTNSHGKTIDFRNTVIIMTSNVGVSDITSGNIGFGQRDSFTTMKSNVETSLKKTFRPEFLNRIDEIIVFDYLTEDDTYRIVNMLCFNLFKRLKGMLTLRCSEKALRAIAAESYDKAYGARPLKRAIQRDLEDPLAERLLTGELNKGDTVIVDYDGKNFVFKKSR